MKKLLFLTLFLVISSVFSAEWYSKAERPQNSSKDTLWYSYANTPGGYVINQPLERATYYKMDDFNVEYPLYLHGVNASFFDEGYGFTYKIYAKDGITILWESGTKTSIEGNNTEFLETSLLLTDDFWFSVTPVTGGYPRQFAEGWDNPTHSYVSDGAGGWINQIENINDEDKYMENRYDILLSEYFDDPPVDVYPPSLRSITGTECFMDRDMDLSIVVQDMNPVISPMQSQYSLDGGSTWTDFNMSVSKTNYTFTGTLPAQIDGTAGLVKFYMEDSLGNATWSYDIDISWSKDMPLFVEDFENETFPPEGWSLNTTGAGWIESDLYGGGYVHGGRYAASHMDDAGPQDDWLITPTISIPADNSTTLTFWQSVYWIHFMNGIHEIGISTDGGVTFTSHCFVELGEIDGEFSFKSVSLSAYSGQDINIGFHYVEDYGSQWYIDDIELFYDYQGPVIVDIIGNPALDPVIGAYVNNDLDITMTVNDDTGIQSIVGHYSYDSGTTWTDLPFSAAKGDETWIATIPAETSPISGIINFDMVDLGGVATPTTVDFDFDFVPDVVPPVPPIVLGKEVFINEPMDLTIIFNDESTIDTCRASYSKDDWVTQYDFEMVPAKIHEYTYVGTIPAETEQVLDGEVIFTIVDSEGNTLNSSPYTVKWIDGQRELWEDFEDPVLVSRRWTFTGNWGVVEEGEFTSTSHALTESPGGNYASNENTTATLTDPLDFTESTGASLSFWCKYDIESGFDYMYLDVTPDNGLSWINLKSWDGEGIDWHQEYFSLVPFVGTADFKLRFRWQSDSGVEFNGMYIDDIIIDNHTPPPFGPIIDHSPYAPEFYEGSQNYHNYVNVSDISGVASVEVIYSIDSLEQDNITATYVSDNQWEFEFPVQQPGKIIDYSFWAVDNDGYETYDDHEYRIVAGRQNIYDSGIVSYYNTTENGDAKAVRFSPLYGERLSTLLIRNYADPTHISDDMTIHVWQDDGGVPGSEVMTPFNVSPTANSLEDTSAMTLIDLREYIYFAFYDNDDYWVGFSSDSGIVYATDEDAVGEGVTEYNRSYDGVSNGDGTWSWSQNSGKNYHFRAVTGYTIGIKDQNIPTTTSLSQNYPNPFNPVTTINFSVAHDNSQIKLVVYNVNGQIVNTLVDGVKNIGKYAVTFDASTFNSGVYYYAVEVNGVKEVAKKMALIK